MSVISLHNGAQTNSLRRVENISDLVSRVKKQDLLAMKLLYQTFSKEMVTLSFRIIGRFEDAEDIIQESFLTSFQEINKLKLSENYRAWLKKIVVNNSLKALKEKVHFEEVEFLKDVVDDPDDNWFEGISFENITNAINTLPNGCRQILTLYLLEDYKHREIAEMLNISISTSKSQYRYALMILKEQLSEFLT